MPRRPHPKRLAKAQEQFKAAVTTYLDSIGLAPAISMTSNWTRPLVCCN